MVIGKPTFVPVQDIEMGFEKMVKIALSSGGRTSALTTSLLFKTISINYQTNCSVQAAENWRKNEG